MPIVAVLAVMALFGFGVYSALGTLKSNRHQTHKPTESQALIALQGSVVVVQQGKLYRLKGLTFTQLQAPNLDWIQVEPAPAGDILAVAYFGKYSNVYLLNSQGAVLRQLLSESAPNPSDYYGNHWAYYPRLSPNGQTLYYVTDWYQPGQQYNVDFQIQSVPFSNPSANPTVWSQSFYFPGGDGYQGGDVEPIPLANGDVIYAKYAVNTAAGSGQGDTYSTLVLAGAPDSSLVQLTTPQQNCAEPALSPNASEMAMICTDNSLQTTTLDVASWNGSTLGPLHVIASGPEPASPTWSPDGTSVLYLNTLLTDKSSPFQLWWVPRATEAKPGTPQQVTAGLDFTATSPPIWSS